MSLLRRKITLVTPPAVEPVTLDEFKTFARIDSDDEDAALDAAITAARIAAENYTRRAFITQTWRLSLDLPPSGCESWFGEGVYDAPASILTGSLPRLIRLLRPPVISITSVTTYDLDDDATVTSSGDYRLDAATPALVLAYGATWPASLRAISALEIVTSNGYGASPADVPQPIRLAVMMHAQQIYETRGQCDYSTPPGCQAMLRAYRVEGL